MKIIQTKKLKAKRDNPNRYRVYDPKGIAPCLNTMGGGGQQPMIEIKQATAKGYAECEVGGY